MNLRLKQLRRLIERSFPEIADFHEKFDVEFEKLENAKSFWSEIYVAHLKTSSGASDSDDVAVIPTNVFIKVPRVSENVLRCENGSEDDRLHQVLVYYSKKENLFYKHFGHNSIPNFPIARVYHSEDITEEGTGGLVAENLGPHVFVAEHIPGLSNEQVLRLMEALGGFHAHLLLRDDKSYVQSFEEGAHGRETFSEAMQTMMFDDALTLESVAPDVFGNGRIQNLKWSFDYENKNKAVADTISAIPGILAHGDLNVTNILWRKESAQSEIGAIIDFQLITVGSVAHDIIRILTLGLSRKVRRELTSKYLEHYFATFAGFFPDGKVPFTMDELQRQYKVIYPYASNFSLFGIAIYIKMYSDGTLGVADEQKANCDELIDRALGIVEDIEELKQ